MRQLPREPVGGDALDPRSGPADDAARVEDAGVALGQNPADRGKTGHCVGAYRLFGTMGGTNEVPPGSVVAKEWK